MARPHPLDEEKIYVKDCTFVRGLTPARAGRNPDAVHGRGPRTWFERAVKDAKLEAFRWYDLRHNRCKPLQAKGCPA
jgi:hypothetical protein